MATYRRHLITFSDGRSNTGNPPIHIFLLDITGAKTSSVSMKSAFPVKFGFNTFDGNVLESA